MWLRRTAEFIRWRDWGPGKIPVLCTVLFYIGLSKHRLSISFMADFALFIIFATLHSALGYVINDWGDRELDALHGKANAFSRLTQTQGVAALAFLLLLALLSGLPFARREMMLPLWAAWAFFAPAYSLRPLRLKERGGCGLAVSFVAQWSLPIMLAFAALESFGDWDMLVFALTITISGATLEVAHQRWDRARDLSTGTGTLAAHTSAAQMDRLFTTALVLDKIAWAAIVGTTTVKLMPVTIGPYSLSPGLPLLGAYIVVLAGSMVEMIRRSQQGKLLDPYYDERRSVTKLLHETMPNLIIPLYLMVLATVYQPLNMFLLLAFVIWRVVLGQADWRWPIRAVKVWWQQSQRSGMNR